MGDPLGIGPEIICKALADQKLHGLARFVVLGRKAPFVRAAATCHTPEFWDLPPASGAGAVLREVGDSSADAAAPGASPSPSAAGGAASLAALEEAIRLAALPEGDPDRVDAIVTAPISKASWALAGEKRFPGHTEMLAARLHAPESGMLFVGPSLNVLLATIHVPLEMVSGLISQERVFRSIMLAHRACIELGALPPGASGPRIAVCGINPHAGEDGLLGSEDGREILPAVSRARDAGVDAHGPLPGDTVFAAAAAPPHGRARYDCVVAMYHDQGLIPVKLLDGFRAVNVTVGLPTVRTSPAHGTAFDIAGRAIADPTSMIEAIQVALRMIRLRRAAAHR